LPDSIVSDQKSKFGYTLEGLEKENVGIFMAVRNILRPFGKVYQHLVILWSFGKFLPFEVT
jgi:hypothetical protein